MDKETWDSLIILITLLVLGCSLYGFVVARPRHQVLVPFVPSLGASIAIYLSMSREASSFHTAFVLSIVLALCFALLLVAIQPWRNRLAAFSWALLGVVAPPLMVIGLITVACWGETQCFG